jgi:hypothetical protein
MRKRYTNPLLGERDLVLHGANVKVEKIAGVSTVRMGARMKSTGLIEGVGVESDTVPVAKGHGLTTKAPINIASEILLNKKLLDQGHHHVPGGMIKNNLAVEGVHQHNRSETRGMNLPSDHLAKRQTLLRLPKFGQGPLTLVMILIPSKIL